MGPVCVKKSEKYGKGVYATCTIKKGELIEQAPVIVVPQSEQRYLKKTILDDYYFYWFDENAAVALGYGSIYNHSYYPNAEYKNNEDTLTIDFYAIKDIKEGEEIMINYNGDPDDKSPLWFEVI